MKMSYEEFIEKLCFRHEFHLDYLGKKYFITQPPYKLNEKFYGVDWYFYEAYSNEQYFKNDEELLANARIDGKLLSEVWDGIVIDDLL